MAEGLDSIDMRILYELDQNCRIPESKLGKIVRKSPEVVRYRIKNMRKNGVIHGYTCFFNATKIGFEAHKIYLKTKEKPRLIQSFLSEMRQRPDVFWIGKGDGAWNIGLTFFSKNSSDFFDKKNEIFSKFKEVVIEQIVGSVVEVETFGKKILSPQAKAYTPAKVFGIKEHGKIDAVDVKIVNAILNDNSETYVEMGNAAGISPELARLRLKRLEKGGLVSRHTIAIDIKKLGYDSYKTFLYFEGLDRKETARLFEIARKHPNVVNFLKVIAPWDIELEIIAENYRQYNEIIGYFREQFSDSLVNVETTAQSMDEVYPSRKIPALP